MHVYIIKYAVSGQIGFDFVRHFHIWAEFALGVTKFDKFIWNWKFRNWQNGSRNFLDELISLHDQVKSHAHLSEFSFFFFCRLFVDEAYNVRKKIEKWKAKNSSLSWKNELSYIPSSQFDVLVLYSNRIKSMCLSIFKDFLSCVGPFKDLPLTKHSTNFKVKAQKINIDPIRNIHLF